MQPNAVQADLRSRARCGYSLVEEILGPRSCGAFFSYGRPARIRYNSKVWAISTTESFMEYTITAAFLLAVVAGSFAAVILGGYGIAHLIASVL